MNFRKRVMKRLVSTMKQWGNDKCFSTRYAAYRVIDELGGRIGLNSLSQSYHEKKDPYIISYLEKNLDPVIAKYKNEDSPGAKQDNAPVWVCWWTGLDNAPKLVKQCVKSTKARAGGHPVILITEKNVSKYLDIPPYFLEKHRSGKMLTAHLCDYIRIALLEKYGGLWLDATIFCASDIPEEYFEYPFFTSKSAWRESRYLSHYQWTTFCIGGRKGNTVFGFLKDSFEKYWLNNDSAIDYLFFDHLIFIGRKHISAIRIYMDAVPENTPHRDDLQAAMNAMLPAEEFWNVIQNDTPIYKLSWRETYSEMTPDGKQSVYGWFLSQESFC